MVLNVLDRPGDGCRALRRLLTDNDEPRVRQRRHILRAIAIYRSLEATGVIERLDEPDRKGRLVRVTVDLQRDFALNQPLSPFILEAIPHLEEASPTYALDVLSVVESTLDNPGPILAAQLDKLKSETMGRLKADGIEYEERLEILAKLEYPKPLREFTYELFDTYRIRHPWAADHNIAPKSVARELFERAMGFGDYVALYQVARSEGLLLRYLSDAYKALVQAVPEEAKTDEVLDLTEWLGELVRQVDSSLLDEWELLRHPEALAAGPVAPAADSAPLPVSANRRAFRVMVRNAMFRRVELAATRNWTGLGELDGDTGWDAAAWQKAFEPYFGAHPAIQTGGNARSASLFQVEERPGAWLVRQLLDDPDAYREWAILAEVDLQASDAAGAPVLRPLGVEQL
jgi:hypothetical protein